MMQGAARISFQKRFSMSDALLDALKDYAAHGRIPMHMPGHKRNTDRFPALAALGAGIDITEIDGFDNLHGAEGILADAQSRAAALWGSDRSYFLINGSSCGILAGIRALTRRGDAVLVSRNAHSSVYHAIELCGLRPVFLLPPLDAGTGICLSAPPEAVEAALDAHPELRLVILTSPTYEGVVSDVAAIAAAAHRHGVPLLVDGAHGAHFSLHPAFPASAISCGADIAVASLHKTLPSLTQTAVLHVRGPRVDASRLAHQLAVFETSSPSYLFLASMDECVRALRERPEILDAWAARLAAFDARLAAAQRLRVLFHDGRPIPGVFAHDPSKLFAVSPAPDGAALAKHLRACGIEPEMVAPCGVLLMTGAGDTAEAMERTADALLAADFPGSAEDAPGVPPGIFGMPQLVLLPEEALERPWEYVSPAAAPGRIAAEYIWAYPPGIPLVVPGERIPAHLPALCAGIPALHGTRRAPDGRVAVLR